MGFVPGFIGQGWFNGLHYSPTVRWGLLDFMWAVSRPCSSFSSSSSSVFCVGSQPRSCEFSVPRWTSTAILWEQCSAPDLNRDPARAVFRAEPQPRCCEFSIPTPDLNRDSESVWEDNVRKNVRRYVESERMSKDMSERMSENICHQEPKKRDLASKMRPAEWENQKTRNQKTRKREHFLPFSRLSCRVFPISARLWLL